MSIHVCTMIHLVERSNERSFPSTGSPQNDHSQARPGVESSCAPSPVTLAGNWIIEVASIPIWDANHVSSGLAYCTMQGSELRANAPSQHSRHSLTENDFQHTPFSYHCPKTCVLSNEWIPLRHCFLYELSLNIVVTGHYGKTSAARGVQTHSRYLKTKATLTSAQLTSLEPQAAHISKIMSSTKLSN